MIKLAFALERKVLMPTDAKWPGVEELLLA